MRRTDSDKLENSSRRKEQPEKLTPAVAFGSAPLTTDQCRRAEQDRKYPRLRHRREDVILVEPAGENLAGIVDANHQPKYSISYSSPSSSQINN